MKDENTGEIRQGVSIQYYNDTTFAPKQDENGKLGELIIKESLPLDLLSKFEKVPGIYEADFIMSVRNSNGKAVQSLTIDDLNYIPFEKQLTFNKQPEKPTK